MCQNVPDNDILQQISFNLQYLFNARERTHHAVHRLSFILLIINFFTDLLFLRTSQQVTINLEREDISFIHTN